MANLPEYEKSIGIRPAAAVSGFQEALGAVGKATSGLADMSYQVAQHASLQQARQAGIEAAKNPGRKLLPAFTPSDAEFIKAYKSEVYNSVKFDSGKTMAELFHTASRNPTSESLSDFEKNSRELIDKNVELVPEDIRPQLKRDLEGDYESNYYRLANAVEGKNKEYLEHLDAAQYEQSSNNIYNNARLGLSDLSDKEYEQERNRIAELERSGQLLPDEANRRRNELWLKKEMGQLDKATEEEIQDGTFEESVKEYREKRPEHLTPMQHDMLVAHKLQYGGRYNAALKAQQNLDFTRAQTLYAQGDLEGAMGFRASMGTANRADFDLYVARHSAENNRITSQANAVIENLDNPIFLSNVTPAPLNHAVDNILIPIAEQAKGSPLSLAEQSELLANQPKAPVESFQKRLSAGLTLGTAEQRLDAARAITIAKENNPALIRGMSKNDLSLADMYQNYSKDPKYQTPDGMDKIRDKIYSVNDDVLAERRKIADTYIKDRGLRDAQYLRADTLRALNLKQSKNTKLPAGLTNVYLNMLTSNIMRTGDVAQAEKDAAFELQQAYQESRIDDPSGKSGSKVMYMAPEHTYTDMGYILQNDKIRAIKGMISHNEEIKKANGFVLQELSWPNAPDTEDLTKGLLHDGEVKINVNGKERQIVVESDATTQLSPVEEISWSFGYLDDNNVVNPIMNPFTPFGTYRFIPDKQLYNLSRSNPDLMANVWQQEAIAIQKKEMSDFDKQQLQKALSVRKKEQTKDVTVYFEDVYD